MLQSQSFLSDLGIPYSDCPTQADIDAKLQAVIACAAAVNTGTYTTPNLTSKPGVGFNFNPADIMTRGAAADAMDVAERAGDVATAHAECDKANSVAIEEGWPIMSCSESDLSILCNATGWLANVAKQVAGGSIPAFSDMPTLNAKIAHDSAATPTPPPAQAPAINNYQALPGPLPGQVLGMPVSWMPAPKGFAWFYFALPFGPTYYVVLQPVNS